MIPHSSKLISARADRKRLETEDRLDDGVVVRHTIVAAEDAVSFTVVAHNPTQSASLAVWAQPCMRVDRFTGTDPEQSREVLPPMQIVPDPRWPTLLNWPMRTPLWATLLPN